MYILFGLCFLFIVFVFLCILAVVKKLSELEKDNIGLQDEIFDLDIMTTAHYHSIDALARQAGFIETGEFTNIKHMPIFDLPVKKTKKVASKVKRNK